MEIVMLRWGRCVCPLGGVALEQQILDILASCALGTLKVIN